MSNCSCHQSVPVSGSFPLSQLFAKIARVLEHSYFKVTKSMQMPEVMSIHIFQGSQRNYIHILPQGSQKFRFFFPSPLWWLIRSWHLGHSPVIAFTVSTMCLETFPRSVWRVCVCVCTHTHMYACNCECKGWPRRRKWFQNDQINITYWGIKQGYWHLSLVFFTRLANLQDSRWKSNFKNK